jgi:hypothetical protein
MAYDLQQTQRKPDRRETRTDSYRSPGDSRDSRVALREHLPAMPAFFYHGRIILHDHVLFFEHFQ